MMIESFRANDGMLGGPFAGTTTRHDWRVPRGHVSRVHPPRS